MITMINFIKIKSEEYTNEICKEMLIHKNALKNNTRYFYLFKNKISIYFIYILLLLFNSSLSAEWSEEKMQSYCNNGYLQECVNLGIYDEKRGDFTEAINKYKKGCDNNIYSGCHNLGRLYKYALGVTQDYQIANEYYEKACKLNSPAGCYSLATSYENGWGVEKNILKAISLHEKSCDLNSSQGCWALAWLFKKGVGVDINYKKSFYYYNKACDLNSAEGCAGLAGFYSPNNTYKIVNVDYNKTVFLFQKACNLGHEKSCNILFQLGEK